MTLHRNSSHVSDFTPEQSAELPFPFGHGNYGIRVTGRPDTDGVATLTLTSPKLVAANAPVLRRHAVDAMAGGASTIAIDLSRCPTVDSRGAQALASIGCAMRRRHGMCVVVGATAELIEWFRVAGLTPNCFEVR